MILPERNVADLRELPAEVARRMTFIGVTHMDEVLEAALEGEDRESRTVRAAPAARVPRATQSGVATAKSRR